MLEIWVEVENVLRWITTRGPRLPHWVRKILWWKILYFSRRIRNLHINLCELSLEHKVGKSFENGLQTGQNQQPVHAMIHSGIVLLKCKLSSKMDAACFGVLSQSPLTVGKKEATKWYYFVVKSTVPQGLPNKTVSLFSVPTTPHVHGTSSHSSKQNTVLPFVALKIVRSKLSEPLWADNYWSM